LMDRSEDCQGIAAILCGMVDIGADHTEELLKHVDLGNISKRLSAHSNLEDLTTLFDCVHPKDQRLAEQICQRLIPELLADTLMHAEAHTIASFVRSVSEAYHSTSEAILDSLNINIMVTRLLERERECVSDLTYCLRAIASINSDSAGKVYRSLDARILADHISSAPIGEMGMGVLWLLDTSPLLASEVCAVLEPDSIARKCENDRREWMGKRDFMLGSHREGTGRRSFRISVERIAAMSDRRVPAIAAALLVRDIGKAHRQTGLEIYQAVNWKLLFEEVKRDDGTNGVERFADALREIDCDWGSEQ
jgi:hypothetical protein